MIYQIISKTFKLLNFKQKIQYFLSHVLRIMSSLLEVIGILSFLPIINFLFQNNNPSILEKISNNINISFLLNKDLSFYLLLMFFIFFLKNLILFIFTFVRLDIEKKNTDYFSTNLYYIFNTYPYITFKKYTDAELLRNIITESKRFERLSNHIFSLFLNIFYILISIFIITIFNNEPKIFQLIILISILLFFFTKVCKNYILDIGNKISLLSIKLSEFIIESYNLFLENYLFNQKSINSKNYKNIFHEFTKINFLKKIINSLPKYLFEIALISIFIFIVNINFNNEVNSAVSFEKSFITIVIILRLLPIFLLVQIDINEIFSNKRPLSNIEDELKILKNLKYKNKIIKNRELFKRLEFKKVSFNYNGKKILKNLNFIFKKGEIVGLLGSSGSGKSTISLIIMGFLNPSQGEIYFNDKKLNQKNNLLNNVKRIGYVSQNIYLKNDTIKNNIILKSDKIDKNKYYKALKISGVEKFLKQKKIKDSLLLKNNGSNLSVGQRQRVAIARSLYNSDQILILDEATSNLDIKTENEILKNLNEIKKDYFILIITHRKNNKKFFDKTIYLK